MNKTRLSKNVQYLFSTNTALFSLVLVSFSFLAIFFSCLNQKNQILNSMEMVTTYTKQEYQNLTDDFWQAYMPFYESQNSYASLIQNYFASSMELTPIEKKELATLLTSMAVRDNYISWVAFYNPDRDTNYIFYTDMTSVSELPADFPYLEYANAKSTQMEIYGSYTFVSESTGTSIDTFAICGGVPYYILLDGSILIGYQTTALAQSKSLMPDTLSSLEYYVVSNGQIVFHSNDNYDSSELFLPLSATEGVYTVNGVRKYVMAVTAGSSTSYVVCMLDYAEMRSTIFSDTPLLIALVIAFFAFSIFIGHSIQKKVGEEVAVIKEGLNILADNNLTYQLPTDFVQSGFPEIAQDINAMSSRLQQSIQKAYYFELKQKDAQMAELQATFNPHFLYNTLEMLRNKCYSNGDTQTAELIANLASIFRSFVGAKTFVPFQEELTYSRKYLSLLVARYGDLVEFSYDIDSELLKYGIIKNVFQLLIENYFVHGFDPSREDNRIEIIGTVLDEENLQVLVRDNGYGMTDQALADLNQKLEEPIRHNKENFGLKNLNQRLRLFYGPDYGLQIESNEGGGLTVSMRLRKITVEEYQMNERKSSYETTNF